MWQHACIVKGFMRSGVRVEFVRAAGRIYGESSGKKGGNDDMDNTGQAVRCRSCGTVTEVQSEIVITDYQCPECWHRHRAGKEVKTNDKY